MELRIVFMGTPDFAVASLNALVEAGCQIVAVITAPDKPAGRGKKIAQSAVKKYAVEHQLPVLQPTNLKDPDFLNQLAAFKPDLQIVVAFRMLPVQVWDLPPLGTFNLHASLLPQYRGAAPINWAVMNGETESGVTTFFLTHTIDTGHIIQQEKVAIAPNENAGELHDKLMMLGARLVLETVQQLEQGDVKAIPQENLIPDEKQLQAAPKIFKTDCHINWDQDTTTVHNHIRGLSPYPAAFTLLQSPDGKTHSLKIFVASPLITNHNEKPGTLLTDQKTDIRVATKNGYIILHEIQLQGKRRMAVADFLRGSSLNQDWITK